MSSLRLVMGDQLSESVSSLRDYQPGDTVLICELWQETTYVRHHKKKLVFMLSAMRHFARELKQHGMQVRYFTLPDALTSFSEAIHTVLSDASYQKIVVTHPGEWRVLQEMLDLKDQLNIPLEIRKDDRFLCSRKEFVHWAEGRKQLRMEHFYREMRKRFNILMEDGKPTGGQWNFDKDNRKSLPDDIIPPLPERFEPDKTTRQVIDTVNQLFPEHFGDTDNFCYAVNHKDALRALDDFINNRLRLFGDYQDAMRQGSPWLFHSIISLYLNIGLLTPMQVIPRLEKAFNESRIPINAAEGFIRQVLGWREFVHGIYWLHMPDYPKWNTLHARRPVPGFYWSADTKMNCIAESVRNTHDNAYAHHIQRLMVLGNFALLAGLAPDQVNQWYMEVYADAIEWVELPNVHGMALFADNGIFASKPYAAGGSYINRMSDYCRHCHFNVRLKSGEQACPFNYLYWDFLDRNKTYLGSNPRLALPYKNLARMSDRQKALFREDARVFFRSLDNEQSSSPVLLDD